jgi:hypothetical protein
MVWNIAVDAAVGSIPIVGDVFDMVWKANDRNFALLNRHRADRYARSWRYWLGVSCLVLLGVACVLAPIVRFVWLLSSWLL